MIRNAVEYRKLEELQNDSSFDREESELFVNQTNRLGVPAEKRYRDSSAVRIPFLILCQFPYSNVFSLCLVAPSGDRRLHESSALLHCMSKLCRREAYLGIPCLRTFAIPSKHVRVQRLKLTPAESSTDILIVLTPCQSTAAVVLHVRRSEKRWEHLPSV